MVFLGYLREQGIDGGKLLVPGATLEVDRARLPDRVAGRVAEAMLPFTDKVAYLRAYADRMRPRIEAASGRWPAPAWTCWPS